MIIAVGSLASGTPPVSPPGNLDWYEVHEDIEEGVAVALRTDGKVAKASQDMSDIFGIAEESGESASDDKIRVQIIMPGIILKGEVDEAVTRGTDVGLHADADQFLNAQTGAIVLKYEADVGSWSHCVWAVPKQGLLF